MKQRKVIKNLKVALKDFEPMVKNPKNLWNGRRIKNFKLLPREAWANWLVCAVLQKMYGRNITFMEDDVGDGLIVDKDRKIIVQTEHVSALNIPEGKKQPDGEQRIIDAINLKIAKGYTPGTLLVVCFDGAGIFFRNIIRETIFQKHNFAAVFCVGLLQSSNKGYAYYVTEFRDSFGEQSITHEVQINADFDTWKVIQIMN